MAISTLEAEHMDIVNYMKETLWFWSFLCDLEIEKDHVELLFDSQGASQLAKKQIRHACTN